MGYLMASNLNLLCQKPFSMPQATLTKGKEAEVMSGTEFGVYLNQSISMPKFAEVGDVNN